jgi:hypothetical protein
VNMRAGFLGLFRMETADYLHRHLSHYDKNLRKGSRKKSSTYDFTKLSCCACRNSLTISYRHFSFALCMAVSRRLSLTSASAPHSNNSRTMFSPPQEAAVCKAVTPPESFVFIFAPLFKINFVISKWSIITALCSAVRPKRSLI